MKYLVYLLIVLMMVSAPVWADDVDPLAEQAQQQIQQRTRDMSDAGVPEAQAQKMLRQMVRNRFKEENVARVQQVVMQNAEAGMATEPVMDKVMEGMAKGVDEDRILQAMQKVQQRQTFSRQVARRLSQEPETTEELADTVYDCLAADMQPLDMERVTARLEVRTRQQTRRDGDEEPLALQTMRTVRTMARLGAHSTDVGEAVCQALQQQYNSRQMQQLGNSFAEQSQQTAPGPLAHQYARALGTGEGIGDANKYGGENGSGSGKGEGGESSSGGNNGNGGSGGSGNGGSGSGSGNSGSGSGSGGSGSGSDSGSGSGSGSSGSDSGNSGADSGNSGSDSGSGSGSGAGSDSGSSSGSGSGSSSGTSGSDGGNSGSSGSGSSGSGSGSSGSGSGAGGGK